MNRTAYLSAIRAIGPGLTARFVEGEFRVSIDPAAIRAAYPAMTYREAIERNESLAAYEMDGESALATAGALRASWLREVAAIDSDYGRAAKAETAPLKLTGSPATAATVPVRETIDMTPTWAAVAPIFVACLEDGTETGRRSARLELNRMAGLADERNAFATTLASIKAALASNESDFAMLRTIREALA